MQEAEDWMWANDMLRAKRMTFIQLWHFDKGDSLNHRDIWVYTAFMENKCFQAHRHKYTLLAVSVPSLLKLLVKQMAHAWGSVHKFCSKCKGERGKRDAFYFKASCLLLQKQPILVPPNKVHGRQVKWADSKGLCTAFDLKSNPDIKLRT